MTVPITRSERSLLPDILRGLAIGGILLVNLQNFAGYVPWLQSGPDRSAQAFIDFFFNGKFVSTFAMLFGAGMALSVARSGSARQVRRLLALLLIGVLHGVLVWVGDILANYALVAFVLLALLRAPTALLAAVIPALLGFTALSVSLLALVSGHESADISSAGVHAAYQQGSYLEVLSFRAPQFLGELPGIVMFYGPWLLGLFLIGVLIARSGVLQRPQEFRGPLWLTVTLGLVLGVPLNLAFTALAAQDSVSAQFWATLLRFAGGLAFALLYGALLALLVGAGRGRWLRPLASVGQLALSNYLLASLVCTFVFNGYGLGLYGRWGALNSLLFALVLFVVQVLLSRWYLQYFSRGPAEWLLRRLTYGRERP
ncbi:DUF418 domain-containing protein [Deinococcus peraridilitoris]|uniref:Putative membrane protein n=1 Tax=Deinococcus peraridilitoris (strain DSM 19664 / LMG 22246 / CIP 109416 / KR-200) TaxID=937777 RepID=L0A2E8_DEIPD|nr:DUF418 domain-containing protein [Deinococcus peraridilitoris]AFZ68073.1 putative membrane protein [Deinococcus peraridilitoris DSM 19664]